jgi:hypothetical protein
MSSPANVTSHMSDDESNWFHRARSQNEAANVNPAASALGKRKADHAELERSDAKTCGSRKGQPHFPKATTDKLKQWFFNHAEDPYPDEEEKTRLGDATGLDKQQITYWFINARKRYWQDIAKRILDEEKKKTDGVSEDAAKRKEGLRARLQAQLLSSVLFRPRRAKPADAGVSSDES